MSSGVKIKVKTLPIKVSAKLKRSSKYAIELKEKIGRSFKFSVRITPAFYISSFTPFTGLVSV
jgi:hypothetical protein